MIVVGIPDRLPGLVTQLDASQPDVLLLEWSVPINSMKELIDDISHLSPSPQVILLSSIPEEKEAVLAAGVDHFILKNAPPDELLLILNRIRLSKTEKILPTLSNMKGMSE